MRVGTENGREREFAQQYGRLVKFTVILLTNNRAKGCTKESGKHLTVSLQQ